MRMCGRKVLRDTDMQAETIGDPIDPGEGLRRGDLVFWKGHVAIMRDEKHIIHANGPKFREPDEEGKLRRALSNDEFELHYQPVVDLASGRVVGAEALLRWEHPTMGTISPADFIPIAEDSGLIVQIEEC